jgi:hypothetical protein
MVGGTERAEVSSAIIGFSIRKREAGGGYPFPYLL